MIWLPGCFTYNLASLHLLHTKPWIFLKEKTVICKVRKNVMDDLLTPISISG